MELVQKVEKVLEDKVRPMLHSHGGEVQLVACSGGVVSVELLGACSGCPAADLSTRGYIEDTLRAELPEIQRVELADSVSPELLEMARRILEHRK